jgi:hypothetical protein
MPTFIKPARVVVDESGSGLAIAAVFGVFAVAAISSVAAIRIHAMVLILIGLGMLAAAGSAWLVHVLRRDGLWLWHAPTAAPEPGPFRLVASRPAPPIPRPGPLAIDQPHQLLHGETAQPRLTKETP